MKVSESWIYFDRVSAIDRLLALMLIEARCDDGAVCEVVLGNGAQCVVRKEQTDERVELIYRDLVAGSPMSLGGYQLVLEGRVYKKDWFTGSMLVSSMQIDSQCIESQPWNDKVLSIMTSLLSKMEVLSKTTKAGTQAKYRLNYLSSLIGRGKV